MESSVENRLPPEATEKINALAARLDTLTEELADRAAAVAGQPTLYHYTSAAGLQGIVE